MFGSIWKFIKGVFAPSKPTPEPITTFPPENRKRPRGYYKSKWTTMHDLQWRMSEIERLAIKAVTNKATYADTSKELGTMPWWFLAIISNMESSQSFKGHLHNGDPLTARTKNVPAGRPLRGNPPFTWKESALDAMAMKGFHLVNDWSIENVGYMLERYNGWGYVSRGLNSPYLWSYTNHWTKGKYVSDGKFDPEAGSDQCGAMPLLRRILELSGEEIS